VTARDNVGFFSRLRWGPGSVATVVSVAVAAALLIALGVKEGDVVLEFSGGLLAFVDLIILVAKGLENITPKTLPPREIIGAEGVVVLRVTPSRPGVVSVGGELWSATSNEVIEEGERVIVVARDGIYLRVSRAPKEP